MANKQINAFTNTALADTDSLIKQSVTGLTARTTLADIKGNLDGRYQQHGTVIWENENGASSTPPLPLTIGKKYEIYTNSEYLINLSGEEFYGRQSKTIILTDGEEIYPLLVLVGDLIEDVHKIETSFVYTEYNYGRVLVSSVELKIYKIVESEV